MSLNIWDRNLVINFSACKLYVLFQVVCVNPGAESGGGREGALTPPDLPNFLYIYIYIYIFFMCVVVKGGDLIEIVINSA